MESAGMDHVELGRWLSGLAEPGSIESRQCKCAVCVWQAAHLPKLTRLQCSMGHSLKG